MYDSTLAISADADHLYELFQPEQKDLGRSSFNVKQKDDKLFINMAAEDATALKTVWNTIAKILIIWEKSKRI